MSKIQATLEMPGNKTRVCGGCFKDASFRSDKDKVSLKLAAKAVNVAINSFVLTGLRQHGKWVSK